MTRVRTLALAGSTLLAVLLAWAGSCAARIHGEMYCWALDSELPIACDLEDEEEVSGVGFQVSGNRRQFPETWNLKPDT
jgi:hypothetical protein